MPTQPQSTCQPHRGHQVSRNAVKNLKPLTAEKASFEQYDKQIYMALMQAAMTNQADMVATLLAASAHFDPCLFIHIYLRHFQFL